VDFSLSHTDNEILSHIKTLLRIPLARRALLAAVEQITFTFKGILENSGIGEISWDTIPFHQLEDLRSLNITDDIKDLPVFFFSLVKKKRRWILDEEVCIQNYTRYFLNLNGIIKHITQRLRKKKIIEGDMFSLSNTPGFHWVSITAKRLSRKKIIGTILSSSKGKADYLESLFSKHLENNLLFINTDKLRTLPDAPLVYRMIEDISRNPELGEAMLEYYNFKMKPLFYDEEYSKEVS